MREILFRAKRTDNKDWVEGLLTIMWGQYHIIKPSDENTAYPIDPETVCQYTGLTDKNGRKIFEGDIVRDIFNASVVGIIRYGEYRNTFSDDKHGGHAGFYVEWKEKHDWLRKDLIYWGKNSEFIGNIFDNPELVDSGGSVEVVCGKMGEKEE